MEGKKEGSGLSSIFSCHELHIWVTRGGGGGESAISIISVGSERAGGPLEKRVEGKKRESTP